MTISISLLVIDPERGPLDESELAGLSALEQVLAVDATAGVEIVSDIAQLIIHDELDDLMRGVCLGGVHALTRGSVYRNISAAGFDTSEIAAEGDMARFTIGTSKVLVPRDEAIAALRAQAGRYAQLLQRAYPQDSARAQEFVACAAG